MKHLLDIFFILIVFLLGCRPTEEEAGDQVPDSLVAEAPGKGSPQEKAPDWDDFDLLYLYRGNDEMQQLAFTFLGSDRLSFRLSIDNILCLKEYWGIAIKRYLGPGAEMDKDENGTVYKCSEYTMEDSLRRITLRIGEDRARIKFEHRVKHTKECLLTPRLIMRKQ